MAWDEAKGRWAIGIKDQILKKSTSSSCKISRFLKNAAAGKPTTLWKSPSILRTSIPPRP